jgi:hypothetical protein
LEIWDAWRSEENTTRIESKKEDEVNFNLLNDKTMKTDKLTNIRHGDLWLIGIKELPKRLKQTKSNVLMVGSHGNNHSFDTGKLYITTPIEKLKEWEFIFGYLVAEGTTLLHKDHGVWKWELKKTKIPNWIYALHKQKEFTNDWLKPVLD